MRKELLYAMPVVGMFGLSALSRSGTAKIRVASFGATPLKAAVSKKVGDTASFTVTFKNTGDLKAKILFSPVWRYAGTNKGGSIGASEEFTIAPGQTVTKTRSFTVSADWAGHEIDLIIEYFIEGKRYEVKYSSKYGKYAWHVFKGAIIEVTSITVS